MVEAYECEKEHRVWVPRLALHIVTMWRTHGCDEKCFHASDPHFWEPKSDDNTSFELCAVDLILCFYFWFMFGFQA